MKVRTIHYIYFWFINSMMALVTGIIMGLVAWRAVSIIFVQTYNILITPLYFLLIVPLCFLFVYQFITASFFWGKRRGEFEYSFLEKIAEGENPFSKLGAQLKAIKKDLKYCDQNAAHIKLEELIKMSPDNFVVTFQYAISCERIGQAKEAIAAYETALKLIPESSKALNIYVDNQINRVKIKGPSKYSGAPGLRYMLY